MILIVEEIHPALMEALSLQEIPFLYQPQITKEEVLNSIASFKGIVVRSKFYIDKDFIDSAPSLRFIARAGSGTDTIDAEYAKQNGIELIHAPEALCDSVAEHTLGLILTLKHKITAGNHQIRNYVWNREANRGIEIKGSTIGIIGYGHTGSAVAKKLSGFGMKVLAYDKYKIPQQAKDGSFFFDAYATSCDLETIYEQSDILTLHIPLTMETMGWVNKQFFDEFKKSITFVNCARGKIVVTTDLVAALQQGKVIGAALDVLEQEPPLNAHMNSIGWFNELQAMDNVVLTPHVAGWSVQSYERISKVLSQKIIAFLNHENN